MEREYSRLGEFADLATSHAAATSISSKLFTHSNTTYPPHNLSGQPQEYSQHSRATFAGSDKENKPVGAPVPITAPVPVLYASLGRAALKSILSIGDEEEDNTPEGLKPQAHIFTENTNLANGRTTIQTSYERHSMASDLEILQAKTRIALQIASTSQRNNTSTPHKEAPIAIRPISPSTLMALTEPCLMAWCTSPMEEDAETAAAFRTSEEALRQLALAHGFYARNSYAVLNNGPNVWGY